MTQIKTLINEEGVKQVLTDVLLETDEQSVLPRFIKALTLNPLSNNESNITNQENVNYVIAIGFQKYLQINEKLKNSEELLTAKQNLSAKLTQDSATDQNLTQTSKTTNQDYNQNQVKASEEWNASKFMDGASEAAVNNTQANNATNSLNSTNQQDNSYTSAEIVYKSQLQALKVYQSNLWKRSVDNILLELSNPLDFNDDSYKRPWFLTW